MPGGKHALLIDPTEEHFGIRLQKESSFSHKSMVKSARSKEKQRIAKAEEKLKLQIASKILDEEAQYEYCKKMLDEIEKRKKFAKNIDDTNEVHEGGDREEKESGET